MALRLAALLVCPAVVIAACGRGDPVFHQACAESAQAIERALAAAPGRVTLAGGTKLSQCVAAARSDSDLQNAGVTLTGAADELADHALHGDAHAPVALGYLIGAARAGARHSAGIQNELVRHVELAGARVIDRGSAAARAALERGMRLGEARG